MIRLEPKRPDETRRLAHDWSNYLGAATISGTPTVTSSDVTISSVSTAGNIVSFTVAAGVDGATAEILMSVTDSAGEVEKETFLLPIFAEEVITLGEAKEYLRVFDGDGDRDRTIMGMITRARQWVEDHTGIALVRRSFVERLLPSSYGIVRLSKGPLVSVDSVDYLDSSGASATLTPIAYPPTNELINADGWPGLADNEKFEVAYTAGLLAKDVDERLRGAMFALIEGEFSEGFAYPERATQAAERCCLYLRKMVA